MPSVVDSLRARHRRRSPSLGVGGAILLLSSVLVWGGCASAPADADTGAAVDTTAVVAEVKALLEASALDWNRDDLDAFMATYADDVLTFVGGEAVVRSKAQVRANYESSYFGGDTEPPDLSFSEIEVRPLGSTHALAFGRWTLYSPGFEAQPPVGTGWFSLVLERHDDGWRIVHDHSS